MAGQILDPRTLNSWEDAFQHPLPIVRRLEQQLRKNIDENRAKLRSLVGASYRELLGTAETIIEMDGQVRTVETSLGEIGKNCNAAVVQRIAENHKRFIVGERADEGEGRRAVVQTMVLQNCLVAVRRTLKSGGDALLAAKVFVLARLLLKSVAESSRPPAVLDELRRKLNATRTRLLSYVERNMARVSLDKARLPRALCGYVLVTSSTPRQVLRHFLQMRLDELNRVIERPSESHVVQMLELYSQTLSDTRDLFPRRFADLLARVSKGALVQDEQVTGLFELNLDIYGSWMPEDFQTFTPWFRHDHLVSSEVTDALAAWMQQARSCVFEGVAEYLSSQDDAQTILDARQKFISNFMELSSATKDVDSTEVIQGVRLAFLERLSELAAQAATVGDLALEDPNGSDLTTSESLSSLWDVATEDYDLSQGAFGLRRALLDARHGRDKKLRVEIEKLDAWMKRLNDFLDIADEMSSTTWEDNSDFHLDETNGDDSLQQILSKQDPEQLRSRLRTVIQSSLTRIRTQLDAVAPSTSHPAFYIRIWREIDWRCQALDNRLNISSASFSVAELHRNLAQSLSKDLVPECIQSAKKHRHVAITLWDGSPPLPVQCSPMIIKFLTNLHRAMEEGGTDVWNSLCVAKAKKAVADALGRGLDDPAFTMCNSTDDAKAEVLTNGHAEDHEANGHVDGEESSSPQAVQVEKSDGLEVRRRARIVQNLFDTLYLGQVLADGGSFDSLVGKLTGNGQVDAGSLERLRKSASEYWRRTYLLFGVLAT